MPVLDPLAQRVAERHLSADSLDQYSRAAKNVGELLKQMIEEAHAGADANYVQPIGEQLPRILGDYKHYVMALAKGIDTIPKGKEQQRAKRIVKELEQVFSKSFDYKWEGARWLSPSTTEKALKKLEPLVEELDKLLTGQRVLFKSAGDSVKSSAVQDFQQALLVRRVVARHLERTSAEAGDPSGSIELIDHNTRGLTLSKPTWDSLKDFKKLLKDGKVTQKDVANLVEDLSFDLDKAKDKKDSQSKKLVKALENIIHHVKSNDFKRHLV